MASATIPTVMKAWQYSSVKGGLPKNLTINPQTTVPKPSPKQHLIKVEAVSINPVDYKPAEIAILHRFAIPKPATPCVDFVGTVMTPAPGSALKSGQRVFGVAKNAFAGGMLAEYALVESESAISLAETMNPVDGATIGIAGLTALQSIVPRAKPGSRIFINGGSGGTGVFGIQFAKAMGHQVTVTCSSRNVELCQSLGAEVIDYTKGSVLEQLKQSATVKKFDLVIDNIFADPKLYWKAHEYTSPGTSYVVVAGTPSLGFAANMVKMKFLPGFLGGGKRKVEGFFAQTKADDLTRIRTWFVEKKVKAVIDQRFKFEQAPQAFEKSKTGRAVGKIIIDVNTSAW